MQRIEPLEHRILLAGAVLDENGVLEITGTVKADTIWITFGPAGLSTMFVRINKEQFSFQTADVTAIVANAGPGDDHVAFQGWATDPERFHIPSTIYGSSGNDFILGSGAKDRLIGGTGDDKIFGGFSRDIIYGEEGYDTLDGGAGNDYIRGGPGSDRIYAGDGIDQLYGDSGHDRFYTVEQNFRVDKRPFLTQPTFDLIDGGSGTDRANSDDVDRLINVEERF